VEQHSHGAGIPLQIRSERPRSTNPSDFPPITIRDEQWRYLPVERLGGLDGALGSFSGSLEGISITNEIAGKAGTVGLPEDLVAANVWDLGQPKLIQLGQESEPQLLTITSKDINQGLQFFISNQKFGKNTLILNHVGTGSLAEFVEIDLADESELTLISIQNLDDDAVITSSQFARLGRGARFKHIVVSIGGKTIRVVPTVNFAGEGAQLEMLGAYFANGDQHIEHRPFVDHNTPNCTSNVAYKGALQGNKAHTVWVGDVLIRQAAEGTKTYELNRNLLLTDGARADSVPNLEIETGQIEGAGHASASGRFDDEQLFYLQARGITELEAKRLVVKGFLNDVISQIGLPELQDELNAIIEAKLEGSK
jgi:Fe-S cluster assembly protein SufD